MSLLLEPVLGDEVYLAFARPLLFLRGFQIQVICLKPKSAAARSERATMTGKIMMDTEDYTAVYIGLPLTSDGSFPTITHFSSGLSPEHGVAAPSSSSSISYGLFAFIVGAVIACFGWVFNQGWSIAALLMFGQFTWTFASAWKHVLLTCLGSLSSAIAFWAIFKRIFPSVMADDDNDNDELDDENASHDDDFSDALQDLGELGFIAGYCGSQALFTSMVCNNLDGLGITCEPGLSSPAGFTLVFVLLWMLCTKMRDYIKASSRRASYVECADVVAAAVDYELVKIV